MQRGWWTSRPQKGAPEKRGHYRDQHQPEDLDPDLLMVEDQENSTQTVVKFGRPSFLFICHFIFNALHRFIHRNVFLLSHFWTECRSRLLHV